MTKKEKLAQIQRSFEDWAVQLETANECGKTLFSTKSAASMCKTVSQLIKVLREDE